MSQETKNAGVALILSIGLISAVALVSTWVREYFDHAHAPVMAYITDPDTPSKLHHSFLHFHVPG